MINGNGAANPLETEIEILETTFDRFYEELFQRYPGVKPLFAGENIASQEKSCWVR